MTAATATRDRWVVCADYASGPFTQAAAERQMAVVQDGPRLCRLPHHIVVSVSQPKPSAPPVRTLADLRAEWDAPFLAGPSDEAANTARSRLTRDLAAAILAADLFDRERMEPTRVGGMQITGAGWSKERADLADAAAERGSPEWIAALSTHEHATLTSDGKSAIRTAWCTCANDDVYADQWIRYEHWTERGCEAHGFVHSECRRLLQTG